MRCRADLELRWKSSSCPRDSAGRISWDAALSWGSQIHLHRAPSNLHYRDIKKYCQNHYRQSLLCIRNLSRNSGFFISWKDVSNSHIRPRHNPPPPPTQYLQLTWQPWGEHGPLHSLLLLGHLSPSLHLLYTPAPFPSPDWFLGVALYQPYPVVSKQY